MTIDVALDQTNLDIFHPILQHGFRVNARVGCSINSMLCDQFGVETDYVMNRIQTIFLEGKPVDDAQTALLKDGATLALSAAMPGLVGATMRCGGYLGAFRGTITHNSADDDAVSCSDGMVTIKLFNLLVGELGPQFLKRGIWIPEKSFLDFLNRQANEQPMPFKSIKKGDREITLKNWSELKPADPKGFIPIKVHVFS
jgi:hypothetical protein